VTSIVRRSKRGLGCVQWGQGRRRKREGSRVVDRGKATAREKIVGEFTMFRWAKHEREEKVRL